MFENAALRYCRRGCRYSATTTAPTQVTSLTWTLGCRQYCHSTRLASEKSGPWQTSTDETATLVHSFVDAFLNVRRLKL